MIKLDKKFSLFGLVMVMMWLVFASTAWAGDEDFEKICLAEPALISLYKAAIRHPDAKTSWNTYADQGLAPDSFHTVDKKVIKGLVWRAKNPNGYLLVVQGTSIVVAEIYEEFRSFRDELNLDVYMYDFRGYGESRDAKTTLAGLISDYTARLEQLNDDVKYERHYVFGISAGGIILSNAMREMSRDIHGVVFDSVPHVVPWYAFCSSDIDPQSLLPSSCDTWLIIGGEHDPVVSSRVAKLASFAKDHCGATTKIEKRFGHVFMDRYTNERLRAARDFLRTLLKSSRNQRTEKVALDRPHSPYSLLGVR